MHSAPIEVGQHVDIWSMACVYSEAAVWSRFGWDGVSEYRRSRQQQVKDRLHCDGEHLFHDGCDVLPIVQKMHGDMAEKPRQIDRVTVEILHLLKYDMLCKENKHRSSATQIFIKIRSAIKTEQKKIDAPTIETFSSGNDEGDRFMSDAEERAKTPPNVPPEYVNSSRASYQRPVSMRVDISSPATSMLMDSAQSYSPHLQSAENVLILF